MTLWDVPARLWTIARKVEDLLALQGKTFSILEAVESRLRALEDRMTHLEADQGQLIKTAGAAASVAATNMASTIISDAVTRITRIEMRQDEIQRRLPPPT